MRVAAVAHQNPPNSQAPATSHWALQPSRCMYCWLVPVAAVDQAERQALELRAPVVLAAVAVASGSLCSLAQRFLLRTPRASCLSALVLAVQQGRA